jgi:hypothetical protein
VQPAAPGTSWAAERTIAEICHFFAAASLLGRAPRANNYSFSDQTGKKTNKKNQTLEAVWLFPNNPPFYVINNK